MNYDFTKLIKTQFLIYMDDTRCPETVPGVSSTTLAVAVDVSSATLAVALDVESTTSAVAVDVPSLSLIEPPP